jgi:hypothetical protein
MAAEQVLEVVVRRHVFDSDSAHGFLFQHHAEFATDVTEFLS